MNYLLPPSIIKALAANFTPEHVVEIDRGWYAYAAKDFRLIGTTVEQLVAEATKVLNLRMSGRAIDCAKKEEISSQAIDKLQQVAIIESKADEKVAPNLNLTAKDCIMTVTLTSAASSTDTVAATGKSFKVYSGVTPKEATAKMLAGKATKATGVEYVAKAVEGGFTVALKEVAPAAAAPAASAGKKVKAAVDWAAKAASLVLAKLDGMGATKEDLKIEDGKTFKIVAKGQTLTWFTKREWADDVVAKVLAA